MSHKRVSKSSPETFKPENYVKHGLSKAEVYELKDAFDLLDMNGKGHLDPVTPLQPRSSSKTSWTWVE